MEKIINQIEDLLIKKRYAEASLIINKEENQKVLSSTRGLNLYGICERALGRPQNAVRAYLNSLRISIKQPGIWTNLGNAYKDINKLESAAQAHAMAEKMLPKKDALILYNHGIALSINNQHSEAIAYYEKALKVDPNKKEIYWDLARSQLALFDYKNGWKNYRARWNSPDAGINKYSDKPWAGEKITDKKIFVYCDQGFGDYIQCFRYINHLLKEAPNKIIIEVKNELKKLIIYPFANEDKIQFVLFNNEKQDIEFDYSIAITDLPIIYAKDYQKLNFEFPYIKTSAIDNELREKLFNNKKLKIGIVWSGSLTFKRNNYRSPDIRYYIENLNLPGVQLYSLQKGEKCNELEKYRSFVIDLDSYINDYEDTAKLINELDVVISMCTSVVHLCGALNKECWVALDYSCHWLWGMDQDKTNWYPSLTLIRQRSPGDWYGVFDKIQAMLIKRLA